MFPRAVLLLLFSCIASSLAAELLRNLETTTEPCKPSNLSETGVLLSVAACSFVSVAIVIAPTILYYKYCSQQLQDEIY